MKKIVLSLLGSLMIGIVLIGCSSTTSKNVPTSDIVNKVKESVEMRATAPIEGELAKEKYHLNLDDIEEFTIENGTMNTGLEAIAVIKAKDGKVDSVKASLEKVKEDKKTQAWYPGEAEAVDATEIKVIGNYVGFFLIPDYEEGQKNTEKAIEIFETELK